MIHSQFLGSVFRSGTPKSPEDSYMESSIVSSGLLGKDPSDLVVSNRPTTALLQTPNSSSASSQRRGKRFPNRRLVTPSSTNRANTSISTYNHNNSTVVGGRSSTALGLSPTRLSSLSASKRKKDQQEIDQFLQELTERLNTAKEESVRPVDPDNLDSDRPSTTFIDERLLRTHKTTEAPNVYFATILPPTTPASGTTFLQMNEVLDKMIESINLEKTTQEEEEESKSAIDNDDSVSGHSPEYDQSINHIFGEVVRQYFIECGSQGELLDKCRDCFMQAQRKIPKIKDHYRSILNSLYAQIEAVEKAKKKMVPEIENNKDHSEHLLKVIAEMKADLDRLIRHHDDLVNSITSTANDSLKMKKAIDELDKTIASRNNELIQLNDQLTNLSKIASQYETDSVNFAENLKQVREQEKETKKQIENSNTQLRVSMQKVTRIDAEISSLSQEVEKIRAVSSKTESSIQVDLISRRLFHQKTKENEEEVRKNPIQNSEDDDSEEEEEEKEEEKKNTKKKSKKNSKKNDKKKPSGRKDDKKKDSTIYDRVKKEFNESVGKKAGDDLHINTYEDFSKMKKVLFKNDDQFRVKTNHIELAESGQFLLGSEKVDIDYVKLFAAKIASDCVDSAIRSKPTISKETQTLSQQVLYDDIEKEDSSSELKRKSTFLSLIDSDYSNRDSQSFEWFMSTINMLYHEKEILNMKCFEGGFEMEDFPHFIKNFAEKKFDLPFLRDQFLWDVYITSHHFQNESLECEMFVDFLDEKMTVEQLAFYLVCRKDCIKVGSSVQVKTRESLEKYNEFYLTVDQVENLMPKWWKNRFQRKFFLKMLDFSIPRPAVHLEATKRYVAMSELLSQCIIDYNDDNIARLGEILSVTRIVPRLKMPEFENLMRSMIPDLTNEKVIDFYRATVSKKGNGRREVTSDQLKKLFLADSILNTIYSVDNDSDFDGFQDEEICEAAKDELAKFAPQFSKILDFFKQQTALQNDNLTLKSFYDDAFRFFSILNQAISSGDGKNSYFNYYQFMFALDVMFSALNVLDVKDEEPSLASIECSIRENWLDTVFGQKNIE